VISNGVGMMFLHVSLCQLAVNGASCKLSIMC